MDFLRRPPPRFAAVVLALLMADAVRSQPANEYELKAAFLYNFIKFVEWPAGSTGAAFCIGIVGQDPFGGALDETVKGRSANGRRLVVKHFKAGQESACEIVFIAGSEKKRLRAVLDRFLGAAVLTVGDMPGFCQAGGVVDFELSGDKVQLQINPAAAQRARLQLSSKLLSLATLVHDAGE